MRCAEEHTREGDPGAPTGVREKARLANPHEAAWQDVLDKAPQNSIPESVIVRD